MRFVVVGAGAIGGLVGARLFQRDNDVTLVVRGSQAQTLAKGLVVEGPDETVTVPIPVVVDPAEVKWTDDTVVLLAVKSQHSEQALHQLVTAAPPQTPVVCMQNGVENERRVVRRFPNTYGMYVFCSATHLRPGVVHSHWTPSGLLDLGRYPFGADDVAEQIAGALDATTFLSEAWPDIMPWKYRKLLFNLPNAIEALCGPGARSSSLADEVQEEGAAVLQAAGIAVVSVEEEQARFGGRIQLGSSSDVQGGSGWKGGSSWQSLERGSGSVESEYLNGEIALLGALHGVATPINRLVEQLALQAALEGRRPGDWRIEQLDELARIARDAEASKR